MYFIKYICQWFGVKENYIEKVKGRWSDMLKYLIHENAPTKHQYDPGEVVSNFDWVKSKNSCKDSRKEEIINGIVEGVIREYNYYEYISSVEYDKYKKSIDNAFKYRADKLKGVNRSMEVIYITGNSGSGKTTYAKMIAEKTGSYFISGSSNDFLEGYKGEDVIILDDLRGSCISASDLFKMLDNNTGSLVKSRYRNKFLECKKIIITSVLPIDEFYKGLFENENEPIKQFKRRCKTYIIMNREFMHLYSYSALSEDYIDCGFVKNPVQDLIQEEESVNIADRLENILGGTIKLTDDVLIDGDINSIEVEDAYKQLGWNEL